METAYEKGRRVPTPGTLRYTLIAAPGLRVAQTLSCMSVLQGRGKRTASVGWNAGVDDPAGAGSPLLGSTPSGSGYLGGTPSVGGGHKRRALAHGYSISTPSGLARPSGRTESGRRNPTTAATPVSADWRQVDPTSTSFAGGADIVLYVCARPVIEWVCGRSDGEESSIRHRC
jgi:hypothetical protein